MSDTDNDEDLKRAIALSLEQSPPTPSNCNPQVIDLTSDDEDDDLDAPVSTKQITSVDPQVQCKDKPNTAARERYQAPGDIDSGSNIKGPLILEHSLTRSAFLGLNRKQMEEERLLRVSLRKKGEERNAVSDESRKRKASISPPPLRRRDSRQVKRKLSASKAEPEVGEVKEAMLKQAQSAPADKATNRNAKPSREENNISQVFSYKNQQRALLASGIQFPKGVVKKTWVYGCPRQGTDIKIEEIFQKDDLELAVLSAYQVDADWVLSKLSPSTKVIWVLQAKDESQKQNWRSGSPKNFRFCFPSMEGNINCMHSKLQLLSHPTYLRICVPSANLVPYDWGESGVMENVCFLIDLPRLPEGQLADPGLTHFGKELLHFVQVMGLDRITIESLKRFDFTSTAPLAFVHSIGGSHSGTDALRTGYPGLGAAIRNLGLHTEQAPSIDFVTASVGSLNDGFIRAIILAAQGDSGLTEYGWRTNRPASGKVVAETVAERKLSDDLKKRFRIYFPTQETVARSKGGIGGGGTICLQPKAYDSGSFPRSLMRDCKSRREGVLMHSKMMFVRLEKGALRGRAWAYVGSANLSESAWGRLVKDKTTKEPKLNCRNWECGVIFPVPADMPPELGQSRNDDFVCQDPPAMEVFRNHIPVPMIVPGEEYGPRRPWFYSERLGNLES